MSLSRNSGLSQDGLAIVEDLCGLTVRACMPPRVPKPQPGPCPSKARLPGTGVRPRRKKAVAATASAVNRVQRAVTTSKPVQTVFAGRGATGTVHKITFEDGTKTVRKRPSSFEDRSGPVQLDAEELANLVAEAVGARSRAMYRSSPGEIYMEFVDGDLGVMSGRRVIEAAAVTPQGRRLGLLDSLIANDDRNDENFFVDPDDPSALVGIDHALSWWGIASDLPGEGGGSGPGNVGPFAGQFMAQSNPLTAAEYDEIRPRLAGLRPQFQARGRGEWFGYTMDVFEQLAARAADRAPVPVGR